MLEMAMREKQLKIEMAASRECEQQMEVTRVATKRKKGGSPRWLEEKEVDSSKTSRCL